MSKLHGAISGFLGGTLFSILIHPSNKSVVFQIRILLNRIWGLPFPLYETLIVTDGDRWVAFGFVVLVFPIIAILWMIVGLWFATRGTKHQWNKKQSFTAWILWNVGIPTLGLLALFIATGNNFSNCNNVCWSESLAMAIWLVVAGVISGSISALYSYRWYKN
jgi:hypothetical protein